MSYSVFLDVTRLGGITSLITPLYKTRYFLSSLVMYEAVEEFSTVIELLPEVLKKILLSFPLSISLTKKVAFPLHIFI